MGARLESAALGSANLSNADLEGKCGGCSGFEGVDMRCFGTNKKPVRLFGGVLCYWQVPIFRRRTLAMWTSVVQTLQALR